MPRSRLILTVAACLVSLLAAVGPTGAQPACRPPAESSDVSLQAQPRADNVLIADTSVTLGRAMPVYVEYGNDATGWLRTPTSSASATHQLALLRLRPASSYRVRAYALDEGGCPTATAEAELQTGDLPRALRPSLLKVSGEPSFPLALMDYRLADAIDGVRNGWLVALDGSGQVVWYFQLPNDIPMPPANRPSIVLKRRANGNLVYQAGKFGFHEITMDGRTVRRVAIQSAEEPLNHHDFWEMPDGRLLFLGHDDRNVPYPDHPGERSVRGDTLHVVDMDTGLAEQVWSAFDVLDPNVRPEHWRAQDEGSEDWTHANAVSIGTRGNVVLSLRNQDQVISLSPDLKSVEWRLGGIGSDFTFADESDRFYGQHAATEIAAGRVLMFDNGIYRPEGQYSRGLELQLDFSARTARKVWEYRHQPDFYSHNISNAVRLPNGNTMVNFGFNSNDRNDLTAADFGLVGRASDAPVLMVEARPDGVSTWQNWLQWPGGRMARYRVYPMASLAGESPVAPIQLAARP